MRLLNKVNAGALQFTLVVIVLIATLLASFVLFIDIHQKLAFQDVLSGEVIRLTDKGITRSLLDFEKTTRSSNESFYNISGSQLGVSTENWGLLEKVTSSAQIKNKAFSKIALIGAKQIGNKSVVLYMNDTGLPLSVAGNTRIVGDVYLPKQGVKSTTVNNQYYNNTVLIQGKQQTTSGIPDLSPEFIQLIVDYCDSKFPISGDQVTVFEAGIDYKNSFHDPLMTLVSSEDVYVKSNELIGNVILYSESKIVLSKASKVEDIILIAPEIIIEDGFKGTVQCFASSKIAVGEQVQLNYPSSLVVYDRQALARTDEPFKNYIDIGKNTKVAGSIVYYGFKQNNNLVPQVLIREDAIVIGEIYCSQNLQLEGTVNGTIYADKFVLEKFGSTYQNHLLNATIDRSGLPKEFIGMVVEENKTKGVAKWLY
ncbi:hypothetical protein [Nonlabens agnitus]|uniref:Uncharacterized protein n=1 Tax=Nonlabens agnitus TaxID=870484 RepID=A0A2S9WQZ1_9FLAO|nr:hypothetical protein [Nonlabens agnitus]PRP65878.1 hypothetical protein BST86_01625 [Nonlabens agnitus]